MIRVSPLLIAAVLASGMVMPAGSAVYGASARPMTLSRQVQLAVTDLTRAYALAAKDQGHSDTVRQAQNAARQARRDYAVALAAAKLAIVPTPELKATRSEVAGLQDRLAAQQDAADWSVRFTIAGDLANARSRLNALEAAALADDADLAVAKATISDSDNAVTDAVARVQSVIQQDPRVIAARQRLDALRKQLSHRH